jgi:hypothetical protein
VQRVLVVILAVLALATVACGAGGGRAPAATTPSVQIEVGTTASIEDVAYVAVERVGFDRLPKARMEQAGEARLPELVRRVPIYRIAGNSKAAMRYTEDGTRGWWAWQPLVVLHARRELARTMNLPLAQIQTVDVTHETWMDACLGTGKPGESCREAVIPGFKVVLRFATKQFTVHTDQKERAIVVPS